MGYSPSNTPVSGDDGILVELDVVSNEDYTSAAVVSPTRPSSPTRQHPVGCLRRADSTHLPGLRPEHNINAGDLAWAPHAYDVNLYNGAMRFDVSGTNSTSPNLTSTLPVPFTLHRFQLRVRHRAVPKPR